MRKHYPAQFKTKAVLELLREEKSLNQVASDYEIHVTQLRKWRQKALQGLPSLFSRDKQVSQKEVKKREEEIEQLYAEIGRLTTELKWLKKKWQTA